MKSFKIKNLTGRELKFILGFNSTINQHKTYQHRRGTRLLRIVSFEMHHQHAHVVIETTSARRVKFVDSFASLEVKKFYPYAFADHGKLMRFLIRRGFATSPDV